MGSLLKVVARATWSLANEETERKVMYVTVCCSCWCLIAIALEGNASRQPPVPASHPKPQTGHLSLLRTQTPTPRCVPLAPHRRTAAPRQPRQTQHRLQRHRLQRCHVAPGTGVWRVHKAWLTMRYFHKKLLSFTVQLS